MNMMSYFQGNYMAASAPPFPLVAAPPPPSTSSDPHDFDCAICMDSMTDPITTPCGHNFCKNCISQHITTNSRYGGGVSCPSCRSPIQSSIVALRVNTVLRDMIQRITTLPVESSEITLSTSVFNNALCVPTMSHTSAPGDKYMAHLTITPPVDGPQQPIVTIISLDLSGSMGTSLPNPTGEKGAKLFTRLDLAKHVCVTTAHMLGDQDILCIIGFSSVSCVVLMPTLMTGDGKKKAEKTIKALKADGGTNIWSALQLMNKIANKAVFTGRNIVSALLTDGETSADTSPRRGEVESYRSMIRPEKLSVFGFSYDINSKLLYQLASVSNCTFGFIPDFSMVGTVFINWMAAALATASLEQTATVTYADGSTSEHKTGLIQFGQARTIVFMSDYTPVSVSLVDGSQSTPSSAVEALSQMANARFELLNKLQFCIGHEGATDYLSIYNKYKNSSDPQVQELMRDIKPAGTDDEGQVSMAPSCWAKWGKHYTRAYYTAVLQETCVNFKDPGLQIYGGKLFRVISEAGDKIFCELPAPEATGGIDVPSGGYATAAAGPVPIQPTTMAAFHNAGGGCWAPGTKVRMADDSFKLIECIKRGDMVWTPKESATVEYLIVLGRAESTQLMCHYKNKVWITPWHPVLCEGTWIHPSVTTPPIDILMPIVYNMVLDTGHIIDVNGVLSVTLGHGFKGPLIEHSFFGNKVAIVEALSKQPEFSEGRPVFYDLKTYNDPNTGYIVGWYDDILLP